jgi:hypothetical protein
MPGILIGNCVIKHNGVISPKPVPISAEITSADLTKVVITFDQALNVASVPATTAFTLTGKTISSVVVVGSTVVLTVTVAYVYGNSGVVVDYIKPILNPITADIGGGKADSFTGLAVVIYPETEIINYVTGLVTPLSDSQTVLLNTFVKDLKSGLSITDLDDTFDVMYILAGETSESSLKNLVKNANHATVVNIPTFTALEGFVGGATKYINSNYLAITDAVNQAQNNVSMGVYSRTNVSEAGVECGHITNDGTSHGIYLIYTYSGTQYKSFNSNEGASGSNFTPTTGMLIGSRASAINEKYYHNGTPIDDLAINSVARIDANIHILAANNILGGNPAYSASSKQISFYFIGKSLSAAEVIVVTNVFEAYMDANGKGVI